jgi:hypothetical protein
MVREVVARNTGPFSLFCIAGRGTNPDYPIEPNQGQGRGRVPLIIGATVTKDIISGNYGEESQCYFAISMTKN